MKSDPEESNNTIDDRQRRLDLNCSRCPPNRKENAKRKGKHGTKKRKYKQKRR